MCIRDRFFFSHGVKTESGDDLSNTSVKNAIAELVKNEPKHKPLSDDKLAKLLDGQGIKAVSYTHLDVYKRQELLFGLNCSQKFLYNQSKEFLRLIIKLKSDFNDHSVVKV